MLAFASAVLRIEGHQVFPARSGDEALRVMKASGGLHLVVTDIVMPGMDGYTLARSLVAVNPALSVLYMSGFSERELQARTAVPGSAPLLKKPFTAEELRKCVRALLLPSPQEP